MSLSAPVARRPIHHREISLKGYEREDGMFDIEGHLVDTKSYSFPNKDRGEIKAGEPIHNMFIRLTVDDQLCVRHVECSIVDSPFKVCPNITPAFKVLEGITIGPGWNKNVRSKLGGVKGCTHLVEMLSPLATATYQTVFATLSRRNTSLREEDRDKPSQLNGCHAMDSRSDHVKERWPEYFIQNDS